MQQDNDRGDIRASTPIPLTAEADLERQLDNTVKNDPEVAPIASTTCPPSRTRSTMQKIISQWFVLGFATVIIVSYAAPNVARRGGYLASEYTFSYGALAVIFLISGLTMPSRVLWDNLHRWRIHVITQGMSFIITPLIGLAIVQCILASGNAKIPQIVLAGIIIMLCTPTTVASNITFTRLAGGDDAAALVEVTIGNLLGIFITPALVQLFLRPSLGLGEDAPTQPVGTIYTELIKHFGLALYLPLFVGQMVQNIWLAKVKKVSALLHLPKWGSVCLLLLLWETFSDSFSSGAFSAIPSVSVILVVFLVLALYPFFTLLSFVLCRPPGNYSWIEKYRFNKQQTTAICFCGPPKSITVGLVLMCSIPTFLRSIKQFWSSHCLSIKECRYSSGRHLSIYSNDGTK